MKRCIELSFVTERDVWLDVMISKPSALVFKGSPQPETALALVDIHRQPAAQKTPNFS